MNNLYDVLEASLAELERGVDLETILRNYPDLVDELRPILMASMNAKRMAAGAPSGDVMRRNRAKLLRHAATLREHDRRTFIWLPSFQKWGLALVLLILFFFSGTSLVRAASSSLPGDGLYPVKRSWEVVTLAFTFEAQAHTALEVEYENERLQELRELFASGRTAQVDFAGSVQRESGDSWRVSHVMVIVSDKSILPDPPIPVGSAVRVYGITHGDGIVWAERIELLPVGASLPEVAEDEPVVEVEEPQSSPQLTEDNSGPGSEHEENATPEVETSGPSSSMTATMEMDSLAGTLTSIQQDVWNMGPLLINVGNAEIEGIPVIGASIEVDGYFAADGVFVATKVKILPDDSNRDEQVNENSNQTNNNSTAGSNSNNNDNDNDNDSSGNNSNEDHSGSGGRGNDNDGNNANDDDD